MFLFLFCFFAWLVVEPLALPLQLCLPLRFLCRSASPFPSVCYAFSVLSIVRDPRDHECLTAVPASLQPLGVAHQRFGLIATNPRVFPLVPLRYIWLLRAASCAVPAVCCGVVPAKSASVLAASTTTLTTWVGMCTTTPSLRCLATGPSATTSSVSPSTGPSSC